MMAATGRSFSRKRVLGCLLALMLPAGVVSGGGMTLAVVTAEPVAAAPRAVRRACRADYKTLCPRYKAGTSRMRACMRANGSLISYRCREALRDHGYLGRDRRGRRRRRY